MYQMNIKDSDISEIKKIIKATIIQKGLSIDDVADMTGYSNSQPAKFVKKFASAFALAFAKEIPNFKFSFIKYQIACSLSFSL